MKNLDCGDSLCRFAADTTGQRTNSGCRCFEKAGLKSRSMMECARELLPLYLDQKWTMEQWSKRLDRFRVERNNEERRIRFLLDAIEQLAFPHGVPGAAIENGKVNIHGLARGLNEELKGRSDFAASILEQDRKRYPRDETPGDGEDNGEGDTALDTENEKSPSLS